ncbi:UTP--glucose-1-phosphate uridylyltransferase [Nephila pilipes]|uniref:UTP--glucose-1-phosphate uridylyltransferase n=1 Tax=Nephila pilipes TaxID=299642 RepID=A0A8X6P053_NEPPI|nr:UTP--glucose-1-phosphate uridylyltransferase [Nephila pilipes]
MTCHLEVKSKYGHQKKISDTTEFKELTKKDAEIQLSHELEKLLLTTANEKERYEIEFAGYKKLFQQFLLGTGPSVQWDKIEPLPSDAIKKSWLNHPGSIKISLNKLVVVKLNGGLRSSVIVPRSRFLPVKKTSDLLLVKSNLYSMQNGYLVMSPLRAFPTVPLVKLGDNHFSKVQEFLRRFASIPDMLELDHLTVSGDVTFGRNVSLKGTVIIIANHGDRIDIPPGSILENKIVSGNLRILDH